MKTKKVWKMLVMLLLVSAASPLLVSFHTQPLFHLHVFERALLNEYLNHQLSVLPITFLFLIAIWICSDKIRLSC